MKTLIQKCLPIFCFLAVLTDVVAQCPAPVAGPIKGAATVKIGVAYYSLEPGDNEYTRWTISGGGIFDFASSSQYPPLLIGNIAAIRWNALGTFQVTATPYNSCGAAGTPVTKTVTVVAGSSTESPELTGPTLVCPGTTVTITAAALAGHIPAPGETIILNYGVKNATGFDKVSPTFTVNNNTLTIAVPAVTNGNAEI
jgi:hypothetical protein